MRCSYTGGYCPYAGIGSGCMNPSACPEVSDMEDPEEEELEEEELEEEDEE